MVSSSTLSRIGRWTKKYMDLGIRVYMSRKRLRMLFESFSNIQYENKGILFYNYSGKQKDKIKINCLYINPDNRGEGVAEQLIGKLYEIAIKSGNVKTIYWNIRCDTHINDSLHDFAEKYFKYGGIGQSQGNVAVYKKYYINI
jgi:predicted GNAT family acetyltransferase